MVARSTTARGVVLTLLAATCLAVSQAQSSDAGDSLRTFLQNDERKLLSDVDKTTKYLAAFVDLNGDGVNEAIVYVIGRSWCGTGGCNMLILARDGTSWKEVTSTTITRPPIRALKTKSNGWRNITVWVQGGGIEPGYEAELRFDGKNYPYNPSAPPARRLVGKVAGKIVLPSSRGGMPLWPEDRR
jgi:hypothetical protein